MNNVPGPESCTSHGGALVFTWLDLELLFSRWNCGLHLVGRASKPAGEGGQALWWLEPGRLDGVLTGERVYNKRDSYTNLIRNFAPDQMMIFRPT